MNVIIDELVILNLITLLLILIFLILRHDLVRIKFFEFLHFLKSVKF